MRIILASSSPTRKALMNTLGIKYEIIPADIDEKEIRDKSLSKQAEKIARAKAEFIVKNNDGIIIAADTFGAVDDRVLEKPKTLDEAKEMLMSQSDNDCVVYTGFCYIDKDNGINYSTTTATKYTFRHLSEGEIDRFVKNAPVMTWSAAFCPVADLYQAGFVKKASGSLTGFYGLPIELLVPLLEKSGVGIFSK